MSALDAPLSHDNARFLKKHFQVYDPVTQGTHQDFSVLRGSKVVLIGEKHSYPIMGEGQNEFFKRFLNGVDCLLLECFPVGWMVKRESCPDWYSLPHSVILEGADVRYPLTDGAQRETFHAANQNYNLSTIRSHKKIKELYKKAIMLANEEIREGRAYIVEGSLQLTSEAFSKLEDILDRVPIISNEHQALYDKIPDLPESQSDNLYVRKSNRGLALSLIKAAGDPNIGKIASVWGMNHFAGKRELFQMLAKEGIKFTVLFPAPRECRKGKAMKRSPKVYLKYFHDQENKRVRVKCSIYSSVAKLCDPALRATLDPINPKNPKTLIWADITWLKTHETLTIQPHVKLCFPIMYPPDGFEDDKVTFNNTMQLLAPTYLAAQRRVIFEWHDEPSLRIKYSPEKNVEYLQISSSEPFEIKIIPKIITTLTALWEHLCRNRAVQYSVPTKTILVLKGYPGCNFENLPQFFRDTLSQIQPDGRKFHVEGSLKLSEAMVDSNQANAIYVTSDEEFRFILD